MRSISRRSYVVVAVALLVIALGVASGAAAKPGSSYSRALKMLDQQQRLAVEAYPAELESDVRVMKEMCQEAQQETDPEAAAVAWRALAQTVDLVATPIWRANIGALRTVIEQLDDLQATFSKEWKGQPHKINRLGLGVTRTEHGDMLFLAGIRKFSDAFDSWHQHDCAGAQRAIDSVNEQVPKAVKKISSGMEVLESLR